MYKGALKAGRKVTATFKSDYSNESSAHLLLGHGRVGDEPIADSVVIAPGASDSVSLTLTTKGTLRVFLDVSGPSESGRLELFVGASKKPLTEAVTNGDTTWLYTVSKPAK